MHVTSTAFQQNEQIPVEYGLAGKNSNPPLTFSEVPPEAKSLALIVEDPDAPGGVFAHWILYNVSPAVMQVMSGELPMNAVPATNDFGDQAYAGPKPPSGMHRYVFKLFALDKVLNTMQPTAKRKELYAAMEGHVLDQAELTGRFTAVG